MRPGVFVSIVGHIGAVLMTLLAWETHSETIATAGSVVPVEIVDVAPESNVRALQIPNPDQDNAPEASEQTQQQEAEPVPAAAPAPAPPRPQRQQQDAFDLNAIARLVDKQRPPGQERNDGAAADRNQRGAGQGTAEVVAMQDRVRALTQRAMMRCWRAPMDRPDPERLVVTIQFDLDRQGNLRGEPRVTSPRNYSFDPDMRFAVESALRAIRTCEPFPFPGDPVVGDHYEAWARLEHTFRPTE